MPLPVTLKISFHLIMATNLIITNPLVCSASLLFFTVPPRQLTVKVRPDKLRPDQLATITCESDSSSPMSQLTWFRGGQVIPSSSNSSNPGAFSGVVSKSTLKIPVTPELHGAVITCQANNSIGPQIHDAVTLEVLCEFQDFAQFTKDGSLNDIVPLVSIDKPHFPQSADYSVDVIEGEPAIVNMTAKANPSEMTYKWFRDGNAIKQLKEASAYDRMTFDGPLLNLTVVRRDDKGDYKCEATNAEGSRHAIVRLNVQCNEKEKILF